MKIEIPCAQCGAILQRHPYRIHKYIFQFCNNACRGKWQTAHKSGVNSPYYRSVIVACAYCRRMVERHLSRTHVYKQQFCNNSCQWEWRRKNGEMVGNNHPFYKGGYDGYYGPNWRQQKRAARKRDSYRCRVCGKTVKQNGRALDVHHVQPFREFGYIPDHNDHYLQANDLLNLITLCKGCHKRAEHGKIAIQPYLL